MDSNESSTIRDESWWIIENTTCSILSYVSGFCRLSWCGFCHRSFSIARLLLLLFIHLAKGYGTQRIQNWLFRRPWKRTYWLATTSSLNLRVPNNIKLNCITDIVSYWKNWYLSSVVCQKQGLIKSPPTINFACFRVKTLHNPCMKVNWKATIPCGSYPVAFSEHNSMDSNESSTIRDESWWIIENTTCSILSYVSGFCRLSWCGFCHRSFSIARLLLLLLFIHLAKGYGTQRIQNWLFQKPWKRTLSWNDM